MPISSLPELLQALRESQGLTDGQFEEMTRLTKSAELEPDAILEELVRREFVTSGQAHALREGYPTFPTVAGSDWCVDDFLAEGLYSVAFTARNISSQTLVALKYPRSDIPLEDAESLFARDAMIHAQLSHPNVGRLIDQGSVQDKLVHLMEYPAGKTLFNLLESDVRLPDAEAYSYIRDIACGLDYLHNQGIIHCDLRPGNLWRKEIANGGSGKYDVVLVDFGQSAKVQPPLGGRYLVMPGKSYCMAHHKTLYRAPEFWGESSDINHRTDLYSLGYVAAHLLGGKEASTATGEIRLRQCRPDLPVGVVEIVERLVQRDPDKRFASAAEVLGALERTTASRIISHRDEGSPVTSLETSRRTPARFEDLPPAFVNVWFDDLEGKPLTLLVGQRATFHVNVGPRRDVDPAEWKPLPPEVTAELYVIDHLDIIVSCPGATLRPGRHNLPLPPGPDSTVTFTLTPRREGMLELIILICTRLEPIQDLSFFIEVLPAEAVRDALPGSLPNDA